MERLLEAVDPGDVKNVVEAELKGAEFEFKLFELQEKLDRQ